ncbi:MAG TPA: arsenosugar biosynthesis radical SAM (seleno)protein ArsS [Thermodesulfovibrionales bacterium]|nr:arsenosugar biosynthesis radical SAM (seleno)protein ArsS [Thermodesulfovibrionales bacterium]
MNTFGERVLAAQSKPLTACGLKTLQLNLGYRCTMACKHCHVSAGPDRKESMDRETAEMAVSVLKAHDIDTLDLTGGAPELNPSFRRLVRQAKSTGKKIIVRTNLTVFFERGMEDLPEFYRDHDVDIIASLPHYTAASVDRVRGEGAFGKSIASLRRLNDLGYGGGGDARQLHLVYNPPGAFLPPSQAALEEQYRGELLSAFDIVFDRLYAFANMPLGRFGDFLLRTHTYEHYMAMMEKAFNPGTLDHLMCRSLLSVGWDGTLYDCDFNQVRGLTADTGAALPHLSRFDYDTLSTRRIVTGGHCFVCAAGQGST